MLQLNLGKAETQRLKYESFYYPCPVVQKRIHAVYMKATVKASNSTIGLLSGLNRQSVGHWIHIYQTDGFDALCQFNYGTNKSQLENHSVSIFQSFAERPPMSSCEAKSRIEELTGISRSPTQVRNFMKHQGLRSSKPAIFRPRPMLRNKKNGLKQPWSQQLKRHGKENAICYLWMRLILFYNLLFVPYGA